MSTDVITIDVKAVYERAVEELAATYDFGYVHYDDRLADKQVAKLLNPDTYDEVANELRDAQVEAAWDYHVDEAINDLVRDDVERAALFDNSEYCGALRQQIIERDEGDPLPQLVRNSGPMLLRYHLGDPNADQDLGYGTDYPAAGVTDNVERHARRLCRMAGVQFTGNNASAFRQMVVEQAYYGGQLYVIWYGYLSDLVSEVEARLAGKSRRRVIRWHNPHVVLLDRYNGSGHDEKIEGTVSKVLDFTRLTTDAGDGGYGWDAVAGVVRSAYECRWAVQPR